MFFLDGRFVSETSDGGPRRTIFHVGRPPEERKRKTERLNFARGGRKWGQGRKRTRDGTEIVDGGRKWPSYDVYRYPHRPSRIEPETLMR